MMMDRPLIHSLTRSQEREEGEEEEEGEEGEVAVASSGGGRCGSEGRA